MTNSISTCACPAGRPGLITTMEIIGENGRDISFYKITHNCTQGSESKEEWYPHCLANLRKEYYCKLKL